MHLLCRASTTTMPVDVSNTTPLYYEDLSWRKIGNARSDWVRLCLCVTPFDPTGGGFGGEVRPGHSEAAQSFGQYRHRHGRNLHQSDRGESLRPAGKLRLFFNGRSKHVFVGHSFGGAEGRYVERLLRNGRWRDGELYALRVSIGHRLVSFFSDHTFEFARQE